MLLQGGLEIHPREVIGRRIVGHGEVRGQHARGGDVRGQLLQRLDLLQRLVDEGKKATGLDKLDAFSGREWAKAFDSSLHYAFEKLGYDGIVYLNRREILAPGEERMPKERAEASTPLEFGVTDAEFKTS